ncbi:hypothetical protein RRG08_043420 [Elysia crispata]|uniref:Glycosyl transferase CAP10 domain-containing protein n=1 Tax=Elysia crispata TaxID=231223 RepID=A0AAE0YLR2_9GAST|nr:hypothetical protein RRG08_043420 [Elysia crispata]
MDEFCDTAPCLIFTVKCSVSSCENVSLRQSRIWGPGLKSDFRLPVRYFFVQLVNKDGSNVTTSVGKKIVSALVSPANGDNARIWTEVLDRHDGSFIVRFRLFSSTSDLKVAVTLRGQHIADSPYTITGPVYHETCNCPNQTPDQWATSVGCAVTYNQIRLDLEPFKDINMAKVAREAVERFNNKGHHSICHYKIIDNKIYRKCYGEHVGFKMFMDSILLSLSRKMVLPDTEFFMNLGDWPLEDRLVSTSGPAPLPIFSWCGSKKTRDIIMPTYDITEATLEMMGRVSLDIFSTQANTGPAWENKTSRAFWRGRDSRRERLDLVVMGRQRPELVDAKLTNMFFFPKDEQKYGQLARHISFFDFFKYKYQLNIDGTVAAYRFPYLLSGDAVVMKQDSEYYEHFYGDLEPYVHYWPLKHDLSDLLEIVRWAKKNDATMQEVAKNGQRYARENLDPASIMCYHVRLLQEYTQLLHSKPKFNKGFELVEQPSESNNCKCQKYKKQVHEEL